jgi:ferric-dicitrate binding protein FerR (iron transport regulator)
MTSLQHIAYSLLLVVLGYLLRGALQGWWRRNPKPHHAADLRHCWLEILGSWHAFTDSDLAQGLARADALTPRFRRRWLTPLLLIVVIGGLGWLSLS